MGNRFRSKPLIVMKLISAFLKNVKVKHGLLIRDRGSNTILAPMIVYDFMSCMMIYMGKIKFPVAGLPKSVFLMTYMAL